MCVQDTMVAQNMQCVIGDLLHAMHSHGGKGEGVRQGGVCVQHGGGQMHHGARMVSGGRLMVVGLDIAPRRLSLVSVYVPQGWREEEERSGMVEEVGEVICWCRDKGAMVAVCLTLTTGAARY